MKKIVTCSLKMGALKLSYSQNIDEQSESRFAYMKVVYKNPTPSEVHGDYQLFGIIVPQGLLNANEYYFGNTPSSTNPNDDSGISLEYFLTAHLVENPYNTGSWLGSKSKIHNPQGRSGYTISFGLDMGTSTISNYSDPAAAEQDYIAGNPNLPNPNQDKEFTLNYYLLNVSQQWRTFSQAQKNAIYLLTSRGINNTRTRIQANDIVRWDDAHSNYIANLSTIKLLDLAYSPSNTIGGYKNSLLNIIPFWKRYYFENITTITTIEKQSGSGRFPKLYRELILNGLRTEANIIERTVLTIIGINAPATIKNNKKYFILAINKHDLFLLAKGVRKCGANENSKTQTLAFLRKQEVKDYYTNVHFNNNTSDIDNETKLNS